MEKIKVNLDMEFERKTKTIQDKNGNNVVIWNWIPFEEKEAFVQEQVTLTLGTDEEQGVCYEVMNYDMFYNYVMVKYYTNIDVQDIQDIDGFRKLYDYCQQTGIASEDIYEFMKGDMAITSDMILKYREAITELYEAEHSLGNMVKQILKTNPDTNNEETRELIEKLTDMKGALMEKEENSNVLQFGKKKSANVKTGGTVINLAKR